MLQHSEAATGKHQMRQSSKYLFFLRCRIFCSPEYSPVISVDNVLKNNGFFIEFIWSIGDRLLYFAVQALMDGGRECKWGKREPCILGLRWFN